MERWWDTGVKAVLAYFIFSKGSRELKPLSDEETNKFLSNSHNAEAIEELTQVVDIAANTLREKDLVDLAELYRFTKNKEPLELEDQQRFDELLKHFQPQLDQPLSTPDGVSAEGKLDLQCRLLAHIKMVNALNNQLPGVYAAWIGEAIDVE